MTVYLQKAARPELVDALVLVEQLLEQLITCDEVVYWAQT